MDESSLVMEALVYVKEISPLLLIIGAISFADLTIGYVVSLFKKMPFAGKMKW